MIFPKDSNLGILVADCPAVKEESQFCSKSDTHGYGGRKVKLICIGSAAANKIFDREGNKDKGDRSHEEAEENIPRRFDSGFPSWELAGINSFDGLVTEK